jgi:hypothetical protein
MLSDAVPDALNGTAAPTCTPSTKNVTVPVGTQDGAAVLQDCGVTVVVTTNGPENWGWPVAGVVVTVVEVVGVKVAPVPLSWITGIGEVSVPGAIESVYVAESDPSVCGANCATSRQFVPAFNDSPAVHPFEPEAASVNELVLPLVTNKLELDPRLAAADPVLVSSICTVALCVPVLVRPKL